MNTLLTGIPEAPSNILPDLAESWNVNGAVVNLALRKDVRWHDSAPFTSKDVAFTLDKYINPEGPGLTVQKSRLLNVAKFEAPDDYTVRITLKQPSASFISTISLSTVFIYPSHIPYATNTWTPKPIGTGPFIFQSFQSGLGYELAKNPRYFKKAADGTSLPLLDAVKYFIIVDRALGQAAFEAGRLECLCLGGSDLPTDQVPQINRKVPDAKLVVVKTAFPVPLHLNNKPPFDNLKFRQAVFVGMDRKDANAAALQGTGYYPPALMLPLPVGGAWAVPDDEVLKMPGFREPKQQDIAQAKQLIQESGINPASVTLTVLTALKYNQTVGPVILAQLSALGIKANLVSKDGAEREQEIAARKFDIFFIDYAVAMDDIGDQVTQRVVTNGGRNYGKWSFPELDAIAERQDGELDAVKRKAMVLDFQRKIYDLAFEQPMIYFPQGYVVQPYVEGFGLKRAFTFSPALRWETTWLSK